MLKISDSNHENSKSSIYKVVTNLIIKKHVLVQTLYEVNAYLYN